MQIVHKRYCTHNFSVVVVVAFFCYYYSVKTGLDRLPNRVKNVISNVYMYITGSYLLRQ